MILLRAAIAILVTILVGMAAVAVFGWTWWASFPIIFVAALAARVAVPDDLP